MTVDLSKQTDREADRTYENVRLTIAASWDEYASEQYILEFPSYRALIKRAAHEGIWNIYIQRRQHNDTKWTLASGRYNVPGTLAEAKAAAYADLARLTRMVVSHEVSIHPR